MSFRMERSEMRNLFVFRCFNGVNSYNKFGFKYRLIFILITNLNNYHITSKKEITFISYAIVS